MKTKRKIAFLLLSISILLLASCSSNKELPTGLYLPIAELPSIEDFSSAEFTETAGCFPSVSSAVLIRNGEREHISTDDPRLIQLMNFLSNSYKNSLDAWLQGVLAGADLEEYLSAEVPMLEVIFEAGSENTSSRMRTPKIVICQDSYLLYLNSKTESSGIEGNEVAEQWWPYMALVSEHNSPSDGSADGWIDLLEYAGFYSN